MDIEFLTRILDLFERSNLAELELSQGGARLRLAKGAASGPASTPGQAAPVERPLDQVAFRSEAARTVHEIKAGFPGTFYRAPAPGEPPFVAEGDSVSDGTQIAILEAMKTMNPVEADRAGIVRAIVVEDGEAVEAGALLFVIESVA